MVELKKILKDHALFMGYTNSYKEEDDPTNFLVYEEGEIDKEDLQFETDRYQVHNANTLARIGKKTDKSFTFTGDGEKLMKETPMDPMLLTVKRS